MDFCSDWDEYVCKECGDTGEVGEISFCEICNKEGLLCCILPEFITKVGNGMDVDMYFCPDCYEKFVDIFLKPVILPSFYPCLSLLDEEARNHEITKQKNGIRRIMSSCQSSICKEGAL